MMSLNFTKDATRFITLQSMLLCLSFIGLFYFLPVGGDIDLNFIQPYIDQYGLFYLRSDWALAKLNHNAVKYILILVYFTVLVEWVKAYKKRLYIQCWEFGYFFVVAMCCTVMIGILKAHASHACPWDMLVIGSNGWSWDFSATDGHCFPGGHASSGFALMVGYFIYQRSNPKRAYFFLIAALILGFSMGWAQMMRGAHFLSHNLWTGWITWCINIMVYALLYQKLPSSKTIQSEDSSPH